MGKRENTVETYLEEQIEVLGGITRKWVSPGHVGVPDRICLVGLTWLVEVKTVDGINESHQQREQKRLSDAGARVAVLYGKAGVDAFIQHLGLLSHGRPVAPLEFR